MRRASCFIRRADRSLIVHSAEWFEKRDICKYLDSIGAWHFKPTTMGFGGSGVPDIIGCYKGWFFSIEVKREGKDPTKLQEKRMEQIAKTGGATFWGTAERVITALRGWVMEVSR